MDGEKDGYVNGVEVVTGISARPGGLKVRVKKVEGSSDWV